MGLLAAIARPASLLLAVAVCTFALMSASPVDPVRAYAGADARGLSGEQRAQIEERWGLDDPPVERFMAWGNNVIHGDLGTSQIYGVPVTEVIADRLPATLSLMALAWLISGVLGFGLGLIAVARRGRWADRIISWWAYLLAATPAFWVGLLLLYVFSVWLDVMPSCCAAPIGVLPGEATLGQRLSHLILPALTLSVIGISAVTLHTRQAAIEALESYHVTFARAQGERGFGLITHRVARNAAAPALMLQFASFGELFGGAVLAEVVFTYPGLGEAVTEAALRQDVPLLMGIALATAVFVFIGNALGDLVHRAVDPRVASSAADQSARAPRAAGSPT